MSKKITKMKIITLCLFICLNAKAIKKLPTECANRTTKTKSGLPCQAWNAPGLSHLKIPLLKPFLNYRKLKIGGKRPADAGTGHNECRNPDADRVRKNYSFYSYFFGKF